MILCSAVLNIYSALLNIRSALLNIYSALLNEELSTDNQIFIRGREEIDDYLFYLFTIVPFTKS